MESIICSYCKEIIPETLKTEPFCDYCVSLKDDIDKDYEEAKNRFLLKEKKSINLSRLQCVAYILGCIIPGMARRVLIEKAQQGGGVNER